MSNKNQIIPHSWVHEPVRVLIEYNDGRDPDDRIVTAIEAKALSDRYWVEKRLGMTCVSSLLIEDKPL